MTTKAPNVRPVPNGATADPAQFARFQKAARELGCGENRDRIDEVVRRAAKLPADGVKPETKAKHRVPAVTERIKVFLYTRRDRAFCDTCLTQALGKPTRASVSKAAATLRLTAHFRREDVRCSACDRDMRCT